MSEGIRPITGIDPRVYDGLQGFTTQPFTEANVKNGTQFALTDEISIDAGLTEYRVFKTGSNVDTLIKTRIISTNGGMTYTPRTAATFTAGAIVDPVGAPASTGLIENLNQKSSNTSVTEYRFADTVTDDGYAFDIVKSTEGVGSNRQQGIFEGLGIERVLLPNTEYLLRFDNNDIKTIYVVYALTWYEGPLSVDI